MPFCSAGVSAQRYGVKQTLLMGPAPSALVEHTDDAVCKACSSSPMHKWLAHAAFLGQDKSAVSADS